MFKLLAGAVGGISEGHWGGGVDLAEGGTGWLLEAGDDRVDSAAGFAIGGFDTCRAELGVGDDFDGFVDVIEDHEFAVEGEEEVGEFAVVLGGRGEFFGFVISDGVIARVTDEAAGEAREVFIVMILLGGEKLLEIG